MRRNRRRASDDAYQAAVSGVAAHLADEDADVHNIVDAAVRDDGLASALHLTDLFATAITAFGCGNRSHADGGTEVDETWLTKTYVQATHYRRPGPDTRPHISHRTSMSTIDVADSPAVYQCGQISRWPSGIV